MEIKRTQVTVTVAFTHEELKVVGLGLIGRLKEPDDIRVAHELNQRLLDGRARLLEEQMLWVDNARERAKNLAQSFENGDPRAYGHHQSTPDPGTGDGTRDPR